MLAEGLSLVERVPYTSMYLWCAWYTGMKHREDRMSGRGTEVSASSKASPFSADVDEEDPEVLYDKVKLILKRLHASLLLPQM